MSLWTCARCDHGYDQDEGDVTQGVSMGTPWANLPEDWTCPDCGASKFEYHQVVDGAETGSGWAVS
jgi:rubredoxin